MSTVTPNLGLFKYDTTNVTDLTSAFNINTALNNNWDKIDEAISNSGGARNIGEIVTSTVPLTDAGLHLLDGALIQGSGIYSDFVNYIAGLYDDTDTPNYFTDENTWQQSITDYGVCGKFVYDSVNNSVRLPKITGIIEGTTDLTALCDLVEAGLPNITGQFALKGTEGSSSVSGAFYAGSKTGSYGGGHVDDQKPPLMYFNASRSNSIYGSSNTVQPQTIKVLYYIVIGTSAKTDIQVDIDNITTDLNGKADTDLLNVPESRGILVEKSSKDILPRWYRVYSDGWCEQGGNVTKTASSGTVSYLKNFKDLTYTLTTGEWGVTSIAGSSTDTAGYGNSIGLSNATTSSFRYSCEANRCITWHACGYIR